MKILFETWEMTDPDTRGRSEAYDISMEVEHTPWIQDPNDPIPVRPRSIGIGTLDFYTGCQKWKLQLEVGDNDYIEEWYDTFEEAKARVIIEVRF